MSWFTRLTLCIGSRKHFARARFRGIRAPPQSFRNPAGIHMWPRCLSVQLRAEPCGAAWLRRQSAGFRIGLSFGLVFVSIFGGPLCRGGRYPRGLFFFRPAFLGKTFGQIHVTFRLRGPLGLVLQAQIQRGFVKGGAGAPRTGLCCCWVWGPRLLVVSSRTPARLGFFPFLSLGRLFWSLSAFAPPTSYLPRRPRTPAPDRLPALASRRIDRTYPWSPALAGRKG